MNQWIVVALFVLIVVLYVRVVSTVPWPRPWWRYAVSLRWLTERLE